MCCHCLPWCYYQGLKSSEFNSISLVENMAKELLTYQGGILHMQKYIGYCKLWLLVSQKLFGCLGTGQVLNWGQQLCQYSVCHWYIHTQAINKFQSPISSCWNLHCFVRHSTQKIWKSWTLGRFAKISSGLGQAGLESDWEHTIK